MACHGAHHDLLHSVVHDPFSQRLQLTSSSKPLKRPTMYKAAAPAHEETHEQQRHTHEAEGDQEPEELGKEDEAWQVSLPMELEAPTGVGRVTATITSTSSASAK